MSRFQPEIKLLAHKDINLQMKIQNTHSVLSIFNVMQLQMQVQSVEK